VSIEARFRIDRGGFVLDVDLSLPGRGVTVLFGRSGSGKTTLLRCVAGLERAPGGRLSVEGVAWQDDAQFLPVHRRPIGYVFQEANLFPHLDAAANMRYGLKRTPPAERRVAWDEVVALMGIGHLLDRLPDALSGGERQRVALARALLASPRLLLMDEPLSALDHARKQEILPYLERLNLELDIPVLYVTHSRDEAARLADHVVFMADGRIERVETLHEAIARPDSPLFDEEGPASVLEGELGVRAEHGLLPFVTPAVRLWLVGGAGRRPGAARLRILARDVALALDPPGRVSVLNQLAATIERIVPGRDGRVTVVCRLADGQTLLAEVTQWSADTLGLRAGSPVFALIKSVALMG
jgi:molybdate transport system ATP-binding protein